MKKTILLPLLLLALLAGCAAESDGLSPVSGGAESFAQAESGSRETPPPAEDDKPSARGEAEKYYDYFVENQHFSLLMGNETRGAGFSDAEIAAYALSELILQSSGSYDQAVGFPKAEIDAVTEKYFGVIIQKYNNQKSVVIPETGNITSTGWGGNSVALVLRELSAGSDGVNTGVFYLFGFGMEGIPASARDDLLRGRFERFGQPFLATVVFEEKTDENGGMYLRYHDVEPGGEADPPYTPYQG